MPTDIVTIVAALAALALGAWVVAHLWIGVVNLSLLDDATLAWIEERHPYLPSYRMVAGTLLGTGVLFVFAAGSLRGHLGLGDPGVLRAFGIVAAALAFGAVAAEQRWPRIRPYVFAVLIGSALSLAIITGYGAVLAWAADRDPYALTLGVACILLAWRFLFGPWEPAVKATVLATFVGWCAVTILWHAGPTDRLVRMLAALVALLPAVLWCLFFLREHLQRRSMVVLMFLAGMLSTAPVLFYDALVRHNGELQLFVLRVVPENFNRSATAFVSGSLSVPGGVRSTLIATLVSFLVVGIIEECSKFWVLRRSGTPFFTSIDDVLQLSIIVAIGFAFAENILNPLYFSGFVQQYLINAPEPQWGAFLGNVLGRAVLTNMVHIVSTGVLGYFFGLALFAGPVLRERHGRGVACALARGLHGLLRLPERDVFRTQMALTGVLAAIVLHGAFNFLVTFPELLPNHPRTMGDLLASPEGSLLHSVQLLLLPSLFYVVGGTWLLTELFVRAENNRERGHLVRVEAFVSEPAMP